MCRDQIKMDCEEFEANFESIRQGIGSQDRFFFLSSRVSTSEYVGLNPVCIHHSYRHNRLL